MAEGREKPRKLAVLEPCRLDIAPQAIGVAGEA